MTFKVTLKSDTTSTTNNASSSTTPYLAVGRPWAGNLWPIDAASVCATWFSTPREQKEGDMSYRTRVQEAGPVLIHSLNSPYVLGHVFHRVPVQFGRRRGFHDGPQLQQI